LICCLYETLSESIKKDHRRTQSRRPLEITSSTVMMMMRMKKMMIDKRGNIKKKSMSFAKMSLVIC
jgi:hypothetical protein